MLKKKIKFSSSTSSSPPPSSSSDSSCSYEKKVYRWESSKPRPSTQITQRGCYRNEKMMTICKCNVMSIYMKLTKSEREKRW